MPNPEVKLPELIVSATLVLSLVIFSSEDAVEVSYSNLGYSLNRASINTNINFFIVYFGCKDPNGRQPAQLMH